MGQHTPNGSPRYWDFCCLRVYSSAWYKISKYPWPFKFCSSPKPWFSWKEATTANQVNTYQCFSHHCPHHQARSTYWATVEHALVLRALISLRCYVFSGKLSFLLFSECVSATSILAQIYLRYREPKAPTSNALGFLQVWLSIQSHSYLYSLLILLTF